MQEDEDAYKEALAKARIEAFEERKALERKMRGMGGRPSSAAQHIPSRDTYKDAHKHDNVIPTFDRRYIERKPSAEEVRNIKRKQRTDAEAAYKQALAKARVEAFNERKVLEQSIVRPKGAQLLQNIKGLQAMVRACARVLRLLWK